MKIAIFREGRRNFHQGVLYNQRMKPSLILLKQTFTIHRLNPDAKIPEPAMSSPFFAITRTEDELSIVLPEKVEIQSQASEPGWVCFKVEGPLDFSLIGILAGITRVLAGASLSVFAASTYETDYILVKREQARAASDALTSAGYNIIKEANIS